MTVDRHPLWESLGIDLERNDEFLGMLGVVYPEVYLNQPRRPKGMDYFDGVTFDIHGAPIQEMLDEKEKTRAPDIVGALGAALAAEGLKN
ncbi:MAG: hypothetical protein JRJ48_02160 [Deltaproteobacteria bacterium]|nr:hypothetical protein [Deltaproteobacteria bacterium]